MPQTGKRIYKIRVPNRTSIWETIDTLREHDLTFIEIRYTENDPDYWVWYRKNDDKGRA